jgi:Pvc16 N-terminal domain/IPT/TIG domain
MSDYLAVGGVTAVLMWLLNNELQAVGPSSILPSEVSITALSPDLVTVGTTEQPQLNLFLYYVSINPALRNLDLPSLDAAGNKVSNPPLALNLHYLVSGYGTTLQTQLIGEVLLGWAMKVLHDNPVVPIATIQEALSAQPSETSVAYLSLSTLAGQTEHLRVTPEALTIEEIYRLWPAFQAHYRPSSAFQVSVVVIQDTTPVMSGLPVRHRRLLTMPLQSPVISGVTPATATAGQVLTISGANFLGQARTDTLVSFDGGTPVAPDLVQGGVVKVTLPPSLQAGTRQVRVLRNVTFPRETDARPLFSSSPAPFQLLPAVTGTSPAPVARGGTLTVNVSPDIGQRQQVTVYLGDYAIDVPPRPPADPAASAAVAVTVPADAPPAGTGPGIFPLRVEVDGAGSLLTPDSSGQWTPQVQVT